MLRLIFTAVFIWSVGIVTVQAANAPRDLLISGHYDAALEAGAATDNADGYVLASEALSAKIILGQVDKPHKQAKAGLDLAMKALAAAPDDQAVRVQHALAYGLMTRTSSPLKAWRKKYATKSRKIITDLQKAYPDLAYGDALLGAWHLGIIRKAGAKNAEKWYGATAQAGMQSYEAALVKSPQDIIVMSNYAVSIFAMDPQAYAEQARTLLESVALQTAETGLERDIQSRMAAVLSQWDDPKMALKGVEAFLESAPDPYSDSSAQ